MQARRRALILAVMLSLAFGLAPQSGAQAAGDAAQGERLARQWCATCHVVAPDQISVTGEAPTFSEVARNPLLAGEALALFLADPHPVMPSMNLSRNEIADIVAYIRSLD